MSITVLFEYNLVLVEAVVLVVENEVGIDMATGHANLEMHVVSGGTAGASLQGNNLTCSDLVACLHQVATVVTVEGGESVYVAYLHAVAITTVPSKTARTLSLGKLLMSVPEWCRPPRPP